MTTNLRDLSAQLDGFQKTVREAHANLVRDTSMELMRRLVNGSPVKTGRFKGNWQASVSTPALEELDTVDPAGDATIARAAAVLRQVRPFSTVYLTNNVPYAKRLDAGGPDRAPASVVDKALAETRSSKR